MLVVVADTSPLRYLAEIGQIELLPKLFEKIFIPSLVYDELCHPSAPVSVRAWANSLPGWLEVLPALPGDDPPFEALDDGERAALALGGNSRRGSHSYRRAQGCRRRPAERLRDHRNTGPSYARAQAGLVDLHAAIGRLRKTNFRRSESMLDALLKKHAQEGGDATKSGASKSSAGSYNQSVAR